MYKYPHRKKNREDSSQVTVKARKLELHVREQSGVQDKFWTATAALHDCNVVEHRRVETTREGALDTHLPLVH
jgi:hypothetical protein